MRFSQPAMRTRRSSLLVLLLVFVLSEFSSNFSFSVNPAQQEAKVITICIYVGDDSFNYIYSSPGSMIPYPDVYRKRRSHSFQLE